MKSVKGSWSRVKDKVAWSENYNQIFHNEKDKNSISGRENQKENKPTFDAVREGSPNWTN